MISRQSLYTSYFRVYYLYKTCSTSIETYLISMFIFDTFISHIYNLYNATIIIIIIIIFILYYLFIIITLLSIVDGKRSLA